METNYEYFYYVFEGNFTWCGNHVLQYNDEDLEGIIYEEYMFFSTDFGEWNRTNFLEAGFITQEIADKMKLIYELSDEMFSPEQEFSANFVRTSPTWKKIFDLMDELRQEMDYIKPYTPYEITPDD